MPESNGYGPPTVFTDRFWDQREGWWTGGVGVVPGTAQPYFGPIPAPTVGPLFGSDDQWINGLSYSAYQAGSYPSPPCVQLAAVVRTARIRQRQSLVIGQPVRIWGAVAQQAQTVGTALIGWRLTQAQTITGTVTRGALLSQAQQVPVIPALVAPVNQAQALAVQVGLLVSVDQAQDVSAPQAVGADLNQAQIVGIGSVDI